MTPTTPRPLGIRWRSREVSRIEALSDAVFGFAVTLLVVSLEVPRNFAELQRMLYGFVPFALSFALLIWIWYNQHVFFRRYGLQDGITVTLNVVLLFVVLFYIYPLKFLFGLLIDLFTGAAVGTRLPDGTEALVVRSAAGAPEPVIRPDQMPMLMSVYAVGWVAIWSVFVLLHLHAYRLRDRLGLTSLEVYDTRTGAREAAIMTGFGVASLALALLGSRRTTALSGWIYALIGPTMWVHGLLSWRRRERIEAGVEGAIGSEGAEGEQPGAGVGAKAGAGSLGTDPAPAQAPAQTRGSSPSTPGASTPTTPEPGQSI